MPHQCLQCGTLIPSGSQDILKGCSKCGGKKFFYITQPVSNEERQRILDRVEKEREEILAKTDENLEAYVREFMHRMQEKDEDKDLLSDEEIEQMFQDAWIKVRGDDEPKKGKRTSKKGDEDWFKKYLEPPKIQIVRDVKKKKGGKKTPKSSKKKKADMKKYQDQIKGAEKKRKGAIGKGKKSPEVIKVLETGVYEIDIQALLEDDPIIVQQDGTYLINLDSVFEKLRKKDTKKRSKKKR